MQRLAECDKYSCGLMSAHGEVLKVCGDTCLVSFSDGNILVTKCKRVFYLLVVSCNSHKEPQTRSGFQEVLSGHVPLLYLESACFKSIRRLQSKCKEWFHMITDTRACVFERENIFF